MSEIPIPTPPESGVSGDQVVGASPSIPAIVSPLSSNRIVAAVEGIVSARPRSLGGDATAALLKGGLLQLSHELDAARTDTKDKEAEISRLNSELTTCKVNLGVLETKLESLEKSQRAQQVCIFFGTVLLNVSLDLYKSAMIPVAAITGLSGLGLLIFGAVGSRLGIKK